MSNYRNANPAASPYVLVNSHGVPMALHKGIAPNEVLGVALGHAEMDGMPIKVYNDGEFICVISPIAPQGVGALDC